MPAFAASLTLSDTRLVVIPAAVVASGDTFDIRLGRAGTITGLVFDNCNNVAGVFTVSKVSSTGVVTSICNVTAAGATGNEITASTLYTALFATTPTYAGTLAARSFSATDTLRITSGLNDSGGIINIDVALSKTPSALQ
jgi:hypothetical protein